ncbi:MAG: hypothetical protein GY802_28500 [Gammaproteobacteria bacterium]|nr:hypothetical protein [Gammaproteobacteria bacterium]
MSATQRFVSWNIRAGAGQRAAGILAQLLDWQPATIGLCEFRGTDASQWLAAELYSAGYRHKLSSVDHKKPAKNALLLASRDPLEAITAPAMPRNRERWLLARLHSKPTLTIGLMHVPNYTSPKLKYPFLNAVLKMMAAWELGPGLLLGDTNCGKRDLDEEKPQGARFKREHDWMVGIAKRGWADGFRLLHGDRREYTWYSHRNNGFRLDQAYTCPQLTPAVKQLRHVWGLNPDQPDRREGLSDHAALVLDLDTRQIK